MKSHSVPDMIQLLDFFYLLVLITIPMQIFNKTKVMDRLDCLDSTYNVLQCPSNHLLKFWVTSHCI